MNVSLIGYRGTGKSTIAAIMAERSGMPVVSLDQAIVAKAGMPIPEIVEKNGWEHFRDLESEVLAEAAARDGLILDCGGGIILREKNRETLKKAGPVVWLTASIEAIVERIKEDTNRPSLTGKSFIEEISEVLEERTPLYRDASTHVVPTGDSSPEKTAETILELIESNKAPTN